MIAASPPRLALLTPRPRHLRYALRVFGCCIRTANGNARSCWIGSQSRHTVTVYTHGLRRSGGRAGSLLSGWPIDFRFAGTGDGSLQPPFLALPASACPAPARRSRRRLRGLPWWSPWAAQPCQPHPLRRRDESPSVFCR